MRSGRRLNRLAVDLWFAHKSPKRPLDKSQKNSGWCEQVPGSLTPTTDDSCHLTLVHYCSSIQSRLTSGLCCEPPEGSHRTNVRRSREFHIITHFSISIIATATAMLNIHTSRNTNRASSLPPETTICLHSYTVRTLYQPSIDNPTAHLYSFSFSYLAYSTPLSSLSYLANSTPLSSLSYLPTLPHTNPSCFFSPLTRELVDAQR